MYHPLHELVGEAVAGAELVGYTVLRDTACGGDQHLPLFCSELKSFATQFCNVDLVILGPSPPGDGYDKVKVVLEIEEANVKPVQVFGKFFSCALSSYFIHEIANNAPVPMADSVLFVQILDTSKLKKDRTAKMEQWRNIERTIQGVIPIKGSPFDHYKLFFGDNRDFAVNGAARETLVEGLRSFPIVKD